jgi:hypothetical protein
MDVFAQAGAILHAEVDFGNCIYFGLCPKRLKTLRFDNWRGFGLDPCPSNLRRDFYEAYKDDPEMNRVDAVICR